MNKSKIAIIGLAVMGQNLARNIANNGHKISVYNRTTKVMNEFIDEYGSENLEGYEDLCTLAKSLEKPRIIGLMIKSGPAIDSVIESITQFLEDGDIIVDFGNSNYQDTIKREKKLKEKNLKFFGCGVSGGEEGALNGPSLMPGGDKETYECIEPILKSIAAKDFKGKDCVTYLGQDGSGHYLKMVHNGIEYGIMQMMAEVYGILKNGFGLKAGEISKIFANYNEGKLKSYLCEIAVPILAKKEGEDYLIDKVLDSAAQKGTGRLTAIESLERGVGLSVITQSVYARVYSSFKNTRTELSKLYEKGTHKIEDDLEEFTKILENALYIGVIISYAQGFRLLEVASDEQNWDLNFSEISRIWQGGCIIRAKVLESFETLFVSGEKNLLKMPEVAKYINENIDDLRYVVGLSAMNALPTLSLSSALNSFEYITQERSTANFIQGLRDYFGAHTFKRTDKEGTFHSEW
ncbi:MAG: 6-phosphogluconate dehydrogenase, decarboxylating (EC [uncultured Campylobacterales bacterium]|uniref:6-phosphogluconate dehydrogenase, decarboxylating n=1 Tax=uncultured Campylobacterales bacterium TaxID=352960 RepID=A0A6S6TF89_9BACT|nr:MAG: 6-phosphogluconate dehydrogenase, decarboxylating (EC [uncultured Campylobacterales bacterium]